MCLPGARERIPVPPLHSQHLTPQRREGLLPDFGYRGQPAPASPREAWPRSRQTVIVPRISG